MSRVILVPLIAGISYEIIRWARKSKSKLAGIVSVQVCGFKEPLLQENLMMPRSK